jgi:hypothetical protein
VCQAAKLQFEFKLLRKRAAPPTPPFCSQCGQPNVSLLTVRVGGATPKWSQQKHLTTALPSWVAKHLLTVCDLSISMYSGTTATGKIYTHPF